MWRGAVSASLALVSPPPLPAVSASLALVSPPPLSAAPPAPAFALVSPPPAAAAPFLGLRLEGNW
jgi:hypothetical protein